MSGASVRPPLRLLQFAFSHFNEKVRWALDWKGLDREDEVLLPGLHARRAQALTGQTQTPILCVGDRAFAGSTAILRQLDMLVPDPPLWPAEAALRREADEWIAWLDDEVGPACRLALFHSLLEEPQTAARMFTAGPPTAPLWKRVPYRMLFPRMVPMLREKMAIDERSAEEARRTLDRALARIADGVGRNGCGQLVGERFGAAELCAASLLFPLCFPAEHGVALPRPSRALDAWTELWAGHPATEWVLGVWKEERLRRPDTP